MGFRSQDALLQPVWVFSPVSQKKSLLYYVSLNQRNKTKTQNVMSLLSSVLDWKQIDFIAQDQFMIVLNKLSLTGVAAVNGMPQFTC